jgi:cytochrome c
MSIPVSCEDIMNTIRKNSRRVSPPKAVSWAIVTTASLAGLLSITLAQAAGDAVEGKRLYDTRCLGCHGDDKTAGTIGPSLIGIIGRKAATGDSGVHSRPLMESGITWDAASLRKFLAAPSKDVPGTIMPVAVPSPQQIDDLIAYLRTLH